MCHNVGDFCYWPKREPLEDLRRLGRPNGESADPTGPTMSTGARWGRVEAGIYARAVNYNLTQAPPFQSA